MMSSAADIPTVLYVSGFSDIVGGGQLSFFLLLRNLNRSRFRPVVLCPEPGEVSREVSAMGIEVLFLEQPKLKAWKLWEIIRYAASLRRLISAAGAGLVHCDTLTSAFLAGLANLFGGIPVVFHARVSDSGGVMDKIVPFLCDRIIGVSKAVAARFAGSPYFADKVRVIYNGVDTAEFTPSLSGDEFRKSHGIPSAVPLLGYGGQLVEAKGVVVLIEAFGIIKNAIPESRLVLAGRGDFEGELRAKVRGLNMEDSVIFAGFVENTPQFMAALDVFILPSILLEGFSRAILEAMACGKPVITTPLGGNTEAVVEGETGFFFQADSSADLARKAVSLLKDRALAARLGENGRRRAVELFDIRRTSEKIHGLYDEFLSGPARRERGGGVPA